MDKFDEELPERWCGLRGANAVDRNGVTIGVIEQIYVSIDGEPSWVTVTAGLFGLQQVVVPLHGSQPRPQERILHIAFETEKILRSPSIDVEDGLSGGEAAVLLSHYGLPSHL